MTPDSVRPSSLDTALSDAHLAHVQGGETDYRGQDLSGHDFEGLRLVGADFTGAVLVGACFEGALLAEANFTDCELSGANLKDAQCEGVIARRAGFGNAALDGACLLNADLRGTTFTSASLVGCDLRNTRLDGARMRNAHLGDADCSRASFVEVDLTGAETPRACFREVNFRGALLQNVRGYASATFLGSDIRDVNFAGAYLLRRHIMDEDYLQEFRSQSKLHRILWTLWWLSSDCGRSFSRWGALTIVITVAYGFIYEQVAIDYGDYPTGLSPYYFSLVTLTTLGYGDVLPASLTAQIVTMSEVAIGYLLLGGLISIMASKIARRAE